MPLVLLLTLLFFSALSFAEEREEKEPPQKTEKKEKASPKKNKDLEAVEKLLKEKAYECAAAKVIELLWKDPKNDEVRLTLVRIWIDDEKYDEALAQVKGVIWHDPTNKTAWLLMADIYRLKGEFNRSILLYRLLLCQERTFPLYAGLAYAHLGVANRSGAYRIATFLKKEAKKEQQEEVKELFEEIERNPFYDFTFYFLQDSDDLTMFKYINLLSWWRGNCVFNLNYVHEKAAQPEFRAHLNTLFWSAYVPVSLIFDVGGNVGFSVANGHGTPIGEIKAKLRHPLGTFLAGTSYTLYPETAKAIAKGIAMWASYFYWDKIYNDRNIFGANYIFTHYSDNNISNRAALYYQYLLRAKVNSECFSFPLNPQITLRYDGVYLDFKKQPGHGVFDPFHLWDNRGTVAFTVFDREDRPEFVVAPFSGYRTYICEGRRRKGIYLGANGTIIKYINDKFFVQGGAEGANYFLTVQQYHYYILTVRVFYEF